MGVLRSLWNFRGFILGGVKREFQTRYAGSLLGFLWVIGQPLAMIFVYTFVFSRVMRAKFPGMAGDFDYSLYLCAGLLPFLWASEVISRCLMVFLANANLIKKTSFPRICLPAISVLSATVNFVVFFSMFLVFAAAVGGFPGLAIFWLVPLFLVQIILTVGLGIFLGVLNVFVRDVEQVVGVALQLWFWVTPIVYAEQIIPKEFLFVLDFNPLTPLVRGYHEIFLFHRLTFPNQGLLVVTGLAVVMLFLGYAVYKRYVGDLVDEL